MKCYLNKSHTDTSVDYARYVQSILLSALPTTTTTSCLLNIRNALRIYFSHLSFVEYRKFNLAQFTKTSIPDICCYRECMDYAHKLESYMYICMHACGFRYLNLATRNSYGNHRMSGKYLAFINSCKHTHIHTYGIQNTK